MKLNKASIFALKKRDYSRKSTKTKIVCKKTIRNFHLILAGEPTNNRHCMQMCSDTISRRLSSTFNKLQMRRSKFPTTVHFYRLQSFPPRPHLFYATGYNLADSNYQIMHYHEKINCLLYSSAIWLQAFECPLEFELQLRYKLKLEVIDTPNVHPTFSANYKTALHFVSK